REITGAPKIDIAALCLGGTLSGIFLAWLAAGGEDIVNTYTLTNTLIDFSEPGILGCFTDRQTQETIGRIMAKRGYLESQHMMRTLNIIRATAHIYNYIGNSWLAGEDPPAFDLLSWNADGTRMPAGMHTWYLRTCYGENQLARGEMTVAGRRLDLG